MNILYIYSSEEHEDAWDRPFTPQYLHTLTLLQTLAERTHDTPIDDSDIELELSAMEGRLDSIVTDHKCLPKHFFHSDPG